MAHVFTIEGVDRTSQIEWASVSKTDVLTKEPDRLSFRVKNYGSKTYRPALDDEVVWTEGSDTLFGGVVVNTSERVDGRVVYFEVECKDYSHVLDRQLVGNVYESMTAAAIIADLLANYTDGTFTDNNVDASYVVSKIVFNYVTVSEALKQLANAIPGNYEWYVDYDKDIHFYPAGTESAPFGLTDDGGNYQWNTLLFEEDASQIRNHIVIRGGDTEGDPVSNTYTADGTARVFFVGYNLTLDSVTVEVDAVSQTVGADGKDDPTAYDCLYNPNDGLIIFPDASKPTAGQEVTTAGTPVFPLITQKADITSIATYGRYEYLIVDKRYRSKTAASQRCDAELERWAYPAHKASFRTLTGGLRAGQLLNIQSTIRNVDRDYIIQRVTTTFRSPTEVQYEVDALASEDVGIIDVLNKLVQTDPTSQIETKENEVVDVIYSVTETITFGEVETAQPLNYATVFVYGDYFPTVSYNGADKKRVFILGGSHLG